MIHVSLLVILATLATSGEATIAFGDGGLRAIAWDGQELLVDGTPGLGARWRDEAGKEGNAGIKGAKPPAPSWDAATRTLVRDYGWARLTVAYAALAGNRLAATITIANTGTQALHRVEATLLRLRVPGLPGWFPTSACSLTGVPAVVLNGSAWSGAWWEPGADETRPAWLDVAVDKGKAGKDGAAPQPSVALRVGGGDGRIVLHDHQLARPIAPGASDSYSVALDLAGPGTPAATVAQAAVAEHAKRRPQTLAWPDRRMILRCFWGGGLALEQVHANAVDPATAVRPATTPAFRERAVNKVKGIIAAARACDAQGVIMWDFEGDRYPHPTTYIGDPRLVAELNPEMDGVADELMKLVTDAGLLAGICIRPSHVVYDAQKGTYWHSHSAQPDPHKELDDKIAYARKRWGCRLFYIDTSVFWKPYGPEKKWEASFVTPDTWKALAAKYPDTLLIPESVVPSCHAHTAPYAEADLGGYEVPALPRAVWPGAFKVVVIEDADPYENFERFVRSVMQGNILMTFGQQPANQNVIAGTRIRAAAALEAAAVQPAVAAAAPAALAGLLADPGEAVRYHAARRLAAAPRTDGAATALAQRALLADESWVVRRAALDALRVQGAPADALPALVALVADPAAGLHAAAGLALAAGGEPAHAVLAAALREAVAKPAGKGRNLPFERLCDAAGASASDALAAALRELLATIDAKRMHDRVAIIRALGDLRDAAALPAILAALAAEGGGVQRACCYAIGRIADAAAMAQAKSFIEQVKAKDKDHAYALGQALEGR